LAVRARTWRWLDLLHTELKASPIPFRYYGDRDDDLWSSQEGRSVARLAWLAHNPADDNMSEFIAHVDPAHFTTDIGDLRMKATRERTKLLAQLGMKRDAYLTIAGAVTVSSLDLLEGWIAAAVAASLETRSRRFREAAAYVDSLGIENFLEWWTDRGLLERQRDATPGVSLMTIHAAKGLQWDGVVVMGADQMPGRSTDDEARAEERRVMYVAVTRARDRLLITRPKVRQGARSALNTSAPFLEDLVWTEAAT
jgi:superfamily I DNA/RNA helicase